MAVLFTDGFDNNRPDESKKYDTVTIYSAYLSTGRTGNYAGMYGGFITKNLSSNHSTIVAGFALRAESSVGVASTFFKLDDNSDNQLHLRVNTSDLIEVVRGDGTILATSSGIGVSTTSWTYIEFKTTISNTGSIILKINGITDINNNSVDTQNNSNSYINKVSIGSNTNYVYGFDDYFLDSSTFQGTVKIYTIMPNGDNSVQWTPNAGTNYNRLDEYNYQNGDTTYVSATLTNLKDLYDMADANITSGVIRSVSHNFTAKKTDLNPTDVQPIIKTSSTEYTGTTQSMTTSYSNYQTIWETNPFSGSGWTYGAIDSLIAGFQTV